MSSIFAPKPTAPSLFTPNNTSNTTTQAPSLFGASTTSQPQASGGLFGASQPAQSGGLFGASTTQTQQQPSTSLFGAQPQQSQTSGLFGSQTSQAPSTGLFGASTTQAAPQQAQSAGLFGTQSRPAQSTSLFGAQPQANQSSSLFGARPAQQGQPTGLFGSSVAQQAQQTSAGNFAGSLSNGLNASTNAAAINAQTQRELAQSRLQSAGLNGSVREKTVPQQIATLVSKWDPTSGDTLLQTYLYNAANPAFAPFYHPSPGESEREYETALAKKPEPVDGNTWVPVLVRGFKALGERVEYQAKVVQSMQVRLHEMNNALTAIMAKHSQELSVRIEAAKRQHTAISQRTMRLAVKCQILRNRGYALDAHEESLRSSLLDLQKLVTDPSFSARSQSIWARMVVLRERTRWLAEESKKIDAAVNDRPTSDEEKIPAAVIERARQILRDYDRQIQQLAKEMQEIQKELAEWQDVSR